MNLLVPTPDSLVRTPAYRLRLATSQEELHAAQRLRYQVFNLELGEGLRASETTGLDADAFDAACDHLLVETEAGETVGTYRLLPGERAVRRGGFYSGQEFHLEAAEAAAADVLELGRACIAAAHRNQTVLSLLWRGVGRYALTHRVRYLLGCSSLTSRCGAEGQALWNRLAPSCLVEPRWRTRPRAGWDCGPVVPGSACPEVPRLMGAYLALGAKICGEPALDREFGTVDFLTWLDLDTLPERARRRFLS